MHVKYLTTLFLIASGCTRAFADTLNSDTLQAGAAPPGWTATRTGSGETKWNVEKDSTAPSQPNVLKQSGQVIYPACIKDDTRIKDGFVEVVADRNVGLCPQHVTLTSSLQPLA
jgi:hypothetical protein